LDAKIPFRSNRSVLSRRRERRESLSPAPDDRVRHNVVLAKVGVVRSNPIARPTADDTKAAGPAAFGLARSDPLLAAGRADCV